MAKFSSGSSFIPGSVTRNGQIIFCPYLAVVKPNRRSIRLPGYDYASAGWYFVTICCKENRHLFGEIRDGQMVLNEAGELVEKWWNKIPEKFPDIELGEYQIMPNHLTRPKKSLQFN